MILLLWGLGCEAVLTECEALERICELPGCEDAALNIYCDARLEGGEEEQCTEGIELILEMHPDCAQEAGLD